MRRIELDDRGGRARIRRLLPALVLLGCSSAPEAAPSTDEPDPQEGAVIGVSPDGGGVPDDGPPRATATTYTNPVFAPDFPDPFVLREGGRYFAFATNGRGKNVPVATSTNLASWSDLPDALPRLPSWAKSNASLTWAPSVLKRGTRFVLYFTARHVASGFQCIGRAVAADPAGPYVDDSGGPFICQVSGASSFCGSIDASPFVDDNGDPYLLWKSDENAVECSHDARLWTQRLGVDGISLLGQPTQLLQRDRPWEAPLVEGPSMLKIDDRYLLFYSANWWESANYGVGWAECSTPVGPCTKKTANGPFVASVGAVAGPGGQEFFTDETGKWWMVYHAWKSPNVGYSNGGARSLRIDPFSLVNGVPTLAGPSTAPRPL